MLPSLCRVMAAIPSVSHFLRGTGGRPRGRRPEPVRRVCACREARSASHRGVVSPGGRPGCASDKAAVFAVGHASRQRLILGFHAASWQHRYLDCGTLFLSGRCGRGTPCRGRRLVAARKEPPVAGACMVGEVLG